MGFERDGDYNGIETVPFLYSGTIAAGKGAVFGKASTIDPASVWALAIEPGATPDSSTGCCFERVTVRNTGATNAMSIAFSQLAASTGSPFSASIAKGDSRELAAGPYAMIAIYSASGTTFEIEGQLSRRANFRDASTIAPAGHPGQAAGLAPLTCDADFILSDSTYVYADATEL